MSCAIHIHVAGPADDLDQCAACGHDLRSLCHQRGTDRLTVEHATDTPAPDRLTALLTRIRDTGEEVEATYTAIDPATGRVRLNADGTAFRQRYVRVLLGQEDVEAARAALHVTDTPARGFDGTFYHLTIDGYNAAIRRAFDDGLAARGGRP